MPTIAQFHGIIIYMYWAEHGVAHLHAIRGDEEAVFAVETGEILAGEMSKKSKKMLKRMDRASPRSADGELAARAKWTTLRTRARTRPMTKSLPKIVRVKPLGGHRLELAFADGAEGAHDLSWIFETPGPMNEPLRDPAYFARVFLEVGALVWPNGFDLSPWNIRKRMEDAGELHAREVAAG